MSLEIVLMLVAIQFYMRIETVKISPGTVAALTKLGQLAYIAFGAYLLISMSNFNYFRKRNGIPGILLTVYILKTTSLAVRCIALMSVLGIKTPSSKKSDKSPQEKTMIETVSQAGAEIVTMGTDAVENLRRKFSRQVSVSEIGKKEQASTQDLEAGANSK